jgi:heavy metal sensor kinase
VEKFDDVQLTAELKLRRVTLKTSVPRFRSSQLPWAWRFLTKGPPHGPRMGPPYDGPNRGGAKGPPRPSIFDTVAPTIFIQYASDTSQRDAKLAGFQAERDSKLATLEGDSSAALQSLRLRLLWICLITFAGIVAGGYWLVRLGLAPLARLSEAVSQVSEKDFRLKVDHDKLPSELQPIAGRLAHTLDQLQRAFDREKQAAADISHELRTPLAAMMTTMEVALRKSRSAAEYRDLLQDIQASGTQMTHLVERLLALARLDAGADGLRPQAIDAAELARQCAHMVRPLAEARGLNLRLDVPEPVPFETDPDKLREILNNLLHNAIEYNRDGGAIDMSVVRVNGHLRLAVRDTGIGIAPEARTCIFERFYRADPSRHADTPHAGLGLAIVKSYVELMGGTIDVQSSDQGTTFTIELPRAA